MWLGQYEYCPAAHGAHSCAMSFAMQAVSKTISMYVHVRTHLRDVIDAFGTNDLMASFIRELTAATGPCVYAIRPYGSYISDRS